MEIKRFIKKGKGKYNIILDNNISITLNEEVIVSNNLLINKNIDKEMFNKLMYENDIENIISKCIHYISIRIRSKKEVEDYIKKLTSNEIIVDETINKLIKEGYINDEKFTSAYVNDKINLTNYGPYKIKNDLVQHKVDINIINKYIDRISDDVLINKVNNLICKYIKNNDRYSKSNLIKKIINRIMSLGYDKKMIENELNNFDIEENIDIVKREYEKLLYKYKDKYGSEELEFIIKQKLNQKGFSYNIIDKIV